MDIDKIKTIKIGKGKQTENVYLTLDLIPIHLIINYDNEVTESNWGGFGDNEIVRLEHKPDIIKKLYTMDVYELIITRLCEFLNLENRDLYCFGAGHALPKFSFKDDAYFYEFQYYGTFGRRYYTRSKLRNTLKITELKNFLFKNCKDKDTYDIIRQLDNVYNDIKKQKILTNKDYFDISNNTLDKFIKNIKNKN